MLGGCPWDLIIDVSFPISELDLHLNGFGQYSTIHRHQFATLSSTNIHSRVMTYRRFGIARLLVQSGSVSISQDSNGETPSPLLTAARNGHETIAWVLSGRSRER